MEYRRSLTGLVVIDPYNDFISEGGKVWDRLKGVAEATNDATASYSDVEMHAALEVNIPNYATAIVSTKEVLRAISQSTA